MVARTYSTLSKKAVCTVSKWQTVICICLKPIQWCLDKNLTMIGTSDIHQPIQTDYDFEKGEHRTMTFVFAKERSLQGIREALDNRRTAAYFMSC